jgi:hypothetical protein
MLNHQPHTHPDPKTDANCEMDTAPKNPFPVIHTLAVGLAILLFIGCTTSVPTKSYPYPKFLDPVTEQVPNVLR